MNDFSKLLSDLLSWYWWATVVLVGVLVNLGSSYLREPLDRAIAAWSGRRTAKAKKRQEELHFHAERLLADPVLLALEMRGETIGLLSSTLLLAFAAVMLGINQFLLANSRGASAIPVVLVFAMNIPPALLVVLSMSLLARASRHGQRIVAARRLKNAA